MMTGIERIGRILKRQPVDRIGLCEDFWGDTQKLWCSQGHIREGEALDDHFGFDLTIAWVFNLVADLDFVPVTLEETGETRLVKDGNYATLRRHKLHDATPEHVDFAVKDGYVIGIGDYQGKRRYDLAGARVVPGLIDAHWHATLVGVSQIAALTTLGVPEVRVIGPRTLLPTDVEKLGVRVFHDMREGLKGVDVVMMLRLQNERMNGALLPTPQEYFKVWGLTADKLALARPDAIVMHPGPMNRGLEISAAAADSARSTIVEQVSNGVAVRMAVLYLLLSGRKDPATGPVVTGGRTGGADGATRKDRRR